MIYNCINYKDMTLEQYNDLDLDDYVNLLLDPIICGKREGDFPGDPLQTIDKEVIWICQGGTEDILYATWTINPLFANLSYKWLLYIDGQLIDRDSSNFINMTVPHGYIPKIAAVAIPQIIDCDLAYDPLCSIKVANVVSLYTHIIQPIRVDLKVLEKTITPIYRYDGELHNHVILNGILIDTDGISGKSYQIKIDSFDNIENELEISIIPLPFIANQDLFNNCLLVDQFFGLICPDILLYNFKYVLRGPEPIETIFGKQRKNYVSVDMKQKGLTINLNSLVKIDKRKAIVNGVLVTKPAKNNQVVLGIQNYRFVIFDKQRFYSVYFQNKFKDGVPCGQYRLPSLNSAIFTTLPNGNYPTDLLELQAI